MYCTCCGGMIAQSDAFCIHCGAPCTVEETEKGSHAIPLVIMGLLFIVGLILFWATQENLPLFVGDSSHLHALFPFYFSFI